jgi:predicted HNH restriction endonuclease
VKRRTPLRRSAIRRKPKADAEAAAKFRHDVLARAGGVCERCETPEDPHWDWSSALDAHHLVSRARGVGWPGLHDAEVNGAALCRRCHDTVHYGGDVADRERWIRSRPVD